jgi:hypothetical protein
MFGNSNAYRTSHEGCVNTGTRDWMQTSPALADNDHSVLHFCRLVE